MFGLAATIAGIALFASLLGFSTTAIMVLTAGASLFLMCLVYCGLLSRKLSKAKAQ